MIPGYAATSSPAGTAAIALPTVDGEAAANIIVSVHSYDPQTFCLQDTQTTLTAAENLIDRIEQAILSLEDTPKRGSVRRTGVFTDREYRQLFVKNYTIVYRVEEENKREIQRDWVSL